MISVLVNWAYVFAVTYILGYFTVSRAYKFYNYDGKVKSSSAIAAGLLLTTVYAGYFSIFHKVGIMANIFMIAVCIVMVFFDREYYRAVFNISDNIAKLRARITTPGMIIRIIAFALLFALAVFYTTEGNFFSDSGYYHEQSIRWIEEYGTVKGSVHILKRLAYNSCYFVQCALFSMRDLFGQSLHCLGGFYAVFLMGYGIFGINSNKRLNILRITPVFYFILFCSEITSPASDFPLVFIVMYVAIRWWELLDEQRIQANSSGHNVDKIENGYVPYALLSIFVVFIISIKLTVGCLVFIVIFPAITMIKEKKTKEITASIIAGIVTILPYFVRNYIICGWLIYPFTKIDLFNPIWKISAEAAQADADEIKIWGRGMGQIGGSVNDSIRTWLPHWWQYMSGPNRLIILSFVLICCAYIVYRIARPVVVRICQKKVDNTDNKIIENDLEIIISDNKLWYERIHKTVFELALLLSLIMWFVESPLFRYGIAYILAGGAYMFADMMCGIWEFIAIFDSSRKTVKVVMRAMEVALCIWILLPACKSVKDYISWDIECMRYYSDYTYFVRQEDYPKVPYITKEMEGITFYCPKEDMGEIGYHIFPAIWHYATGGIHKLGDDIKDGFYYEADD